MWWESDEGMLDCVCCHCGWSRRLVAAAQGAAGPLHVVMHIRQCCAPLTDEELEADQTSLEEELAREGA